MTKLFRILRVIFFILTVLLLRSCKKDKPLPPIPIVETSGVFEITETTSVSGGYITDDGGSPVNLCGVCWSTNKHPTINNKKTINEAGITYIYNSKITGLTANTFYYVRAYATNSGGTGYGDELLFKTLSGTVYDNDGIIYYTVTIGTQLWMADNLKTSKFNDGTAIPVWGSSTIGFWQSSMDPDNFTDYGAFYNWYAVNTGKLCPQGWHVPTDAEWTTLTDYLTNNGYGYGGNGIGIAKSMACTSWWAPWETPGTVGNDEASNNSSGFSAFPLGALEPGFFWPVVYHFSWNAVWWSSTEYDTTFAWNRNIKSWESSVFRDSINKQYGFPVRCVKDN
jgi:uncharacterized protein (TIGR02145 family)